MVLPFRLPKLILSFSTGRSLWSRLTSTALSTIFSLYPFFFAVLIKAQVSLGKQDPPYPAPAFKKCGEILLSSPIPRATFVTSAPTFSHRLAISLIKLILVAKKALEAYLIISALSGSVNRTFPPIGL